MIFGGYGRKSKTRGEVFFPCMECEALNPFALLENYGYGQLYGVRLAKYKTDRFLVCAHCRQSYGLDKEQWSQAILVAQGLKARGYELSLKEQAESAVHLARNVFPEMADEVRSLLAVQLGEASLEAEEEAAEPLALESTTSTKVCPDCAETVKEAARKCRFCGYLFPEESELDVVLADVVEDGTETSSESMG